MKKSIFYFLFLLFISFSIYASPKPSGVSPEAIKLPDGPGSISGLGQSFDTNLFSGTASYGFPIELPKGALAPILNLNYNGGLGNGIIGLGWSFNFPKISRLIDKGLPTYDDSKDRFIYQDSGTNEELVHVGNNIYRLKNESSFLKIERIKDGDLWKVHHKNGLIAIFGETAASVSKTGSKKTFLWHISEIGDQFDHKVKYSYAEDKGTLYPKRIVYQDYNEDEEKQYRNVVDFIYSSDGNKFSQKYRTDPVVNYTTRERVEIREMLRNIKISHGHNEVWCYALKYKEVNGFLLLEKVQKSDSCRNANSNKNKNPEEMPPLVFEYTSFNVDNAAVEIVDPPVKYDCLKFGNCVFADMNGDGLPDILDGGRGGHYKYIQNLDGQNFASDFVSIDKSPNEPLGTSNTMLMDINGDSYLDIVSNYLNTATIGYYSGKNIIKDKKFEIFKAISGKRGYIGNSQLKFVDVTFDGKQDILVDNGTFTGERKLDLYINDGENWNYKAEIDGDVIPPLPRGVEFSDSGVKFRDMNGDGLSDIIVVRLKSYSEVKYEGERSTLCTYYNKGFGFFDGPKCFDDVPYGSFDNTFYVDTNGDGLTDIVKVEGARVLLHLNTGNEGFAEAKKVRGNLPEKIDQRHIDFADLNGNGSTDVIIMANRNGKYVWYIVDFFGHSEKPNLLKRIDNGLGKITEIEYKSSAAFAAEDRKKRNDWTTSLPKPVNVVSKIKVKDSLGWEGETTYHYSNGYWDGKEKEFRGFKSVSKKEIGDDSQGTLVVRSTFNVGDVDEALKGKVEHTVTQTEGDGILPEIFQETFQDWDVRTLIEVDDENKVVFAYSPEDRTTLKEKAESGWKYLKNKRTFDKYGNLVKEEKLGEVDHLGNDVGDDEIITETLYINDDSNWMLGFPKKIIKRDNVHIRSIDRIYYDYNETFSNSEEFIFGEISLGRKTREESFLIEKRDVIPKNESCPKENSDGIPKNESGSCWVLKTKYKYDRWGNVEETENAVGQRRTIVYDPNTHSFPVEEIVHLDNGKTLSTKADYYYDFGVVKEVTDYNGNKTHVEIDNFGRVTEIYKPGDVDKKPSTRYTYVLENPISYVKTEVREQMGGDSVITSYNYVDGLGRIRQKKMESEDEKWLVSNNVIFNKRNSAIRTYKPYFSDVSDFMIYINSSLPYTENVYDEKGRVKKKINADNTFETNYYRPFESENIDEENNSSLKKVDGKGRVIELLYKMGSGDKDDIRYSYHYTTLDSLNEFTDPDNNIKRYYYDTLNRRYKMNDPSSGEKNYEYYDNGALYYTIDNKNQKVIFSYGRGGRLKNVKSLDNKGLLNRDVKYHYDNADGTFINNSGFSSEFSNLEGALAWVEDSDHYVHYSYDNRGRTVRTIKEFFDANGEGVTDFSDRRCNSHLKRCYSMTVEYDSMGRVMAKVFPDKYRLEYDYNKRSLLTEVNGGQEKFLSRLTYNEFGQCKTAKYGNKIEFQASFDPRNFRITNSIFSKIKFSENGEGKEFYFKYLYDNVGNVKSIDSSDVDFSQSFTYDRIYRLKEASGLYGKVNWTYTKSGNIESRTAKNPIELSEEKIPIDIGEYSYGETENAGPYAVTSIVKGNKVIELDYDRNGNVSEYNGMSFTYDSMDQLTEVVKMNMIQTNRYDAGGKRTRKRIVKKVINEDSLEEEEKIIEVLYIFPDYEIRDGEIYHYVMLGKKKLARISGYSQTSIINAYLSDVSINDEMQKIVDVDKNGKFDLIDLDKIIVDKIENDTFKFAQKTRYYVHDHLGSTVFLTDEMGVAVSKSAEVPYGIKWKDEIFRDGEKPLYSYTGKEMDDDIGISYFGSRYYINDLGRWLTADPLFMEDPEKIIENPMESNLYVYANNRPVKMTDPDGESASASLGSWVLTDAATPDPTDILPVKWFAYGVGFGITLIVDAKAANYAYDSYVSYRKRGKAKSGSKPGAVTKTAEPNYEDPCDNKDQPKFSEQAAEALANKMAGITKDYVLERTIDVGSNVLRMWEPNYEFTLEKSHHGWKKVYKNSQGHRRVVAKHTKVGNGHYHAGMPKAGPDQLNVDFKIRNNKNGIYQTGDRYKAIDREGTEDHHICLEE